MDATHTRTLSHNSSPTNKVEVCLEVFEHGLFDLAVLHTNFTACHKTDQDCLISVLSTSYMEVYQGHHTNNTNTQRLANKAHR